MTQLGKKQQQLEGREDASNLPGIVHTWLVCCRHPHQAASAVRHVAQAIELQAQMYRNYGRASMPGHRRQVSEACRQVFFSRMTVAASRPVSGSRIRAQNAYTLCTQHSRGQHSALTCVTHVDFSCRYNKVQTLLCLWCKYESSLTWHAGKRLHAHAINTRPCQRHQRTADAADVHKTLLACRVGLRAGEGGRTRRPPAQRAAGA